MILEGKYLLLEEGDEITRGMEYFDGLKWYSLDKHVDEEHKFYKKEYSPIRKLAKKKIG